MDLVDSKIFCSVPGCKSWRNKNPEISFYEFPEKGTNKVYCVNDNKIEVMDRQDAWRIKLKIDVEDLKNVRVCSLHFVDNDYMIYANKKRRMKQTAVPTQNLPKAECVSSDENADRAVDEPIISLLPVSKEPSSLLSSLLSRPKNGNRKQGKVLKTAYNGDYRKRKHKEEETGQPKPGTKSRNVTERKKDVKTPVEPTSEPCSLQSKDVLVNDFTPFSKTCPNVLKFRGRRIIDVHYFFEKLQTLASHRTTRACSLKMLSVVREISIGLSSDIQIYCRSCNTHFTFPTSDPVLGSMAEVNRGAVAGTVAAGLDYEGFTMLFNSMGIPTMTREKFEELRTEDCKTEEESNFDVVPAVPVQVYIKEGDCSTFENEEHTEIEIKEEFP